MTCFSSKKLLFIVFNIIFISFVPFLSFLTCVLSLLLLNSSKSNISRDSGVGYIIICTFFLSLSTAISAYSQPIFLYEEQDFTTYYNNYIFFLENGFDLDGFVFGAGAEVALPLINYFLSIVIQAEYPYLVKLCYVLMQISLFLWVIALISRRYSLNWKRLALLIALMFLFFKYGATLNHLRQGFSSFFVVLALFSSDRRSKIIFFILASLFHVSALVIYPTLLYVFKERCFKIALYNGVVIAIVAVGGFVVFKLMMDFVLGSDLFFLAKAKSAFMKVSDESFYVIAVKEAIVASIYAVFALFILVFAKVKKDVFCQLFLLVVITIGFGYIPGLTTRLFASVFTILMGYYFFMLFNQEYKFSHRLSLSIFLLLLFSINWFVNSPIFYYNFPLVAVKPFYYLSDLFLERGYVIRSNLPSEIDMVIQNPYR
ncbi:EpsG family protein [Shewanella baltica]|uniref:EpsG family protein n=1 Tax=Shewanella baltica TaxID=62322 RepID=UPI00325E3449